jgi:hypothetical protein
MAMMLTEPGGANALATSHRVINLGYSGKGWQTQYNATVRPTSPYGFLLGGGKDRAVFGVGPGVNDMTAASGWPKTNATADPGALTANDTVARANEVYDTAGTLDSVFTGSISAAVLTVTAVTSGAIRVGMSLDVNGGTLFINSLGTGTGGTGTYNLNTSATVASQTITARQGDARRTVTNLLTLGWKVAVSAEIKNNGANDTGSPSPLDTLRGKLLAMAADVQAGPGQTYDGKFRAFDNREIVVGGLKIFGTDAVFSTGYYTDGVHPNDTGRPFLVSGGTTPQHGVKANIEALT